MKIAKWFWKRQRELDKEYEKADYCRICNITLYDDETICCTCTEVLIDDWQSKETLKLHHKQIKGDHK